MSFTLGCCAACRAPFLPNTEFFYEDACQAVFYLQNRFPAVSRGGTPSQFTGSKHRGHLITVAHMKSALQFGERLTEYEAAQDARNVTGRGSGTGRGRDDSTMNAVEKMSQADRDEIKKAMEKAVQDAIHAGASAPDSTARGVEAALDKTAEIVGSVGQYKGSWTLPAPLDHPKLAAWLQTLGLTPIVVNYTLTLDVCALCNSIYDTFARMGDVLTDTSMINTNAITASITKNKKTTTATLPSNKSENRAFLGLLIGHYMHRSMRFLHGQVPAVTLDPLCPLASLLAFLPLHLVCTHLEMTVGLANGGKRVKGAHNYLGNMDLIISYYMHACAQAELSNAPDITQFGVFYLRELVECPAPVWDPRHRNLCDYVFDGAPQTNRADLVAHASDRLCELWQSTGIHLARMAIGEPCAHPDPDWTNTANAYFASRDELNEGILTTLDTAATQENIAYFIEHVGIAATLWQMRRYLQSETARLGALLDEWLRAFLLREWTNIMDNSHYGIDMLQAQQVYAMQNVLRPERIVGDGRQLGLGFEISLLRAVDADAVEDLLAEAGRCSVFKAAARLRKWHFNVVSPPLLYEPLEARAGLPRLPAPGPRLLGAPAQPHRTSLSTWASLSERLMAARSASTARSGSSGGVCQGASALRPVARRRG